MNSDSGLGRRRAAQGVTQQRLANSLRVTVTHLCRVERGRAKPSVRLAKRIAGRLGIPEGEFWDDWNRARRGNLREEMADTKKGSTN